MNKKLMVKKSIIIDAFVYIGIFMIVIFFLIGLDYSNSDKLVIVSFIINGSILFGLIIWDQYPVSIRKIGYTFAFIFHFMAPMQQYTSKTIFWNYSGMNLKYSDSEYLYANIVLFLSILFFELGYKSHKKINKRIVEKNNYFKISLSSAKAVTILSIGAIIILGLTGNIAHVSNSESSMTIQLFNILRYIPVASILLLLIDATKGGKIKQICRSIIWIICFVIYFPLWGSLARFILLGTYVVFASFGLRKSKYKSLLFGAFFLGFCLMFSETRHMSSFMDILLNRTINFNHVDFDAHQLLMASIKYVKNNHIFYGLNIFSALFFLLPRSIWKGKAEGTGSIVMKYFGSWQLNVSTPLVAELYTAFSIWGVILGFLLLGRMVYKIDQWSYSCDPIKISLFCLFAGMTTYILRGSLLASVAFTGGLVLSMFFTFFVCKIFNGELKI